MAEVFQHLSAESTKMEPTLLSAQVLKQEAEEMGLQGKDIVIKHQKLDRKEGTAGSSENAGTGRHRVGKDISRRRREKEG